LIEGATSVIAASEGASAMSTVEAVTSATALVE